MYKVTVQLEGIERRKGATGLLHIAAGFFLLAKTWDYYRLSSFNNTPEVAFYFLVVLLCLGYGFFKKFIDSGNKYNQWLRVIQAAAFGLMGFKLADSSSRWVVMVVFVWAGICIFLALTEKKVYSDAVMIFNNDNIKVPGYVTDKMLPWIDMEDVVVRTDYITLFQKGGTYVQYEVLKNMDGPVVDEINLYCAKQIEKAASLAVS